jgi:hypothetical protein
MLASTWRIRRAKDTVSGSNRPFIDHMAQRTYSPRGPIRVQSKEYEWGLPWKKELWRLLPLGQTPKLSQLAAREGNGYEHCPYHSKVHNRSPGKYEKMNDTVYWRANGFLTNISVRKCDFIEKLKITRSTKLFVLTIIERYSCPSHVWS